jgi:hypothetical protein
MLVITL